MRRSLSQDMIRFGNLATRSQLRLLGYSVRDIRREVEARKLWPIGRSWLAARGADGRATRAVALGGRLAAETALISYGVWVTRATGLWVASPQSASRLPLTKVGEHRLWVREHFPVSDDRRWRMSLGDSLAQFARRGSFEDVVAAFDSALNKRLLSTCDLEDVLDRLPRKLRRGILHQINGKAESGLETLLRLAALAEGWGVEVQVKIIGVGRVDIVIDGWLVIEADGAEWHDDEASQEEDRRREAELILRGYRWHRFRYRQVLDQMPLCLEVIRVILSSGRPVALTTSRSASRRVS